MVVVSSAFSSDGVGRQLVTAVAITASKSSVFAMLRVGGRPARGQVLPEGSYARRFGRRVSGRSSVWPAATARRLSTVSEVQ